MQDNIKRFGILLLIIIILFSWSIYLFIGRQNARNRANQLQHQVDSFEERQKIETYQKGLKSIEH